MQFFLIICIFTTFLIVERLHPGRVLPDASGWYIRALALNLCQLALVYFAGMMWNVWAQDWSILYMAGTIPPALEGFFYWFVGTFIFYWWHRLRHRAGWWRVFHQVHHSPTRIEVLTAFYKHPLEMFTNTVIISVLIYVIFGGSIAAAVWYNVYGLLGELYYHMNVRTPRWTGWFLQRPEHHAIHHERGVHQHNFGDITWWDRLFGTFKEADDFVPACGFAGKREQRLGAMLAFEDVNE